MLQVWRSIKRLWVGQLCYKRGSANHFGVDCLLKTEELDIIYCYCKQQGRTHRECKTRKKEELDERKQYLEDQKLKRENVWKEREEYAQKKYKEN